MKSFLFTLTALASISAQAGNFDGQFFGGVGIGQSAIDVTDYEDKEMSKQLFVGYQFNDNISADVSYLHFGKFSQRNIKFAIDNIRVGGNARFEATSLIDLYAGAGISFWDVDAHLNGSLDSLNDEGFAPYAKVGAAINIKDNSSLFIEYSYSEVEPELAGIEIGETELSSISINLVFAMQ